MIVSRPFVPSRVLLALLLAIPLAVGGCQTLGNWALTQVSPIDWKGQTRIELPLGLNKWGMPTVPVRVTGHGATAMVDSGASLPVISRKFAVSAGVRIRGSIKNVNGQRRESVENVLIDLGAGSSTLGLAIVDDSLADEQIMLGANIFQQAVVDMDFSAHRLTLIHPDAFRPPTLEPVSVELVKGVPAIQIRINGSERQICAIVDTGYNGGVALLGTLASGLALRRDPTGRETVAQGAFGERVQQAALAPLDEVRIGALIYHDIQVGLAPPDTEQCANLLGMAVLSRHHLIFDLRNHRIWILPLA